jgi:4a-hydroxytetrahydrobiopterin dehydratase
MVALAKRSCTPCRGGASPLTPSECVRYLAELPDWELREEGRIVARRFRFPDYRAPLAFANAVSVLAEETWHHPELVLGFGFCEVSLTTRKIGGLHEFDFVMAARIDASPPARSIPPGCRRYPRRKTRSGKRCERFTSLIQWAPEAH